MRFAEMTWPELRSVDRRRVVVVAPIAACEQHGPHLPTCTDTVLATAVAEAAERALPERSLLLPTLWLGASQHHLPFGATLSANVEVHVRMIVELLTPLLEDGYQRVLVLNGHGGNVDTFQLALRQLHARWRDRTLAGASYWDLASAEFAAIAEGPRKSMGHACEFETSMMLALRPDLVRIGLAANDHRDEPAELRGLYLAEDMAQRTRRGVVGFPELATAAKGQRLLAAAAQRVAEVVEASCEPSADEPRSQG